MAEVERTTPGPRVLLLPNESRLGDQVGVRRTFFELNREGAISELKDFSFLVDLAKDSDELRSKRELLEIARAFRPDIIFWQHPGSYSVDGTYLTALRNASGNALLVYHEADAFHTFYKPLGASEKALYLQSDVFLTAALGEALRMFQAIRRHSHYYYVESCIDRERFGSEPAPELIGASFDAVMIGSIARRMKVLKYPGSGGRIALARGLAELMGDRFAVFGKWWPPGINCRGSLSYTDQHRVLQSSKMSVIWDHFPRHTFYFSDRLPIALTSGVPHITNRRAGYETVLAKAPGLFFAETVADALDIATYLRGLSRDEIGNMGAAARSWAFNNLEAGVVFRRAFGLCARIWRERGTGLAR